MKIRTCSEANKMQWEWIRIALVGAESAKPYRATWRRLHTF